MVPRIDGVKVTVVKLTPLPIFPIQMVEAGCRPGALYYRYQMDARGENPSTVTVWKNWRKGCLRIF